MKKIFIIFLVCLCFFFLAGVTDAIRLKDSNNVYLGKIVGVYKEFVVVLIESGFYFLINTETGEIPGKIGQFFFEYIDCSGDPYLQKVPTTFDFPMVNSKYVWRCYNNYYFRTDTTVDLLSESIHFWEPFFNDYICNSFSQTIECYILKDLSQDYVDIINAIIPPLTLY